MTEQKKPLVVVLAANSFTALGVIRALGVSGYPVALVAGVSKAGDAQITAASRFLEGCDEILLPRNAEEEADRLLTEAVLQYTRQEGPQPLLIPADCKAAAVVSRNYEAVAPHFRMPVAAEQLLCAEDADQLLTDLAQHAGLQMQKTWEFSLEEEVILPEDMIFPCICQQVEEDRDRSHKSTVCADEDSFHIYMLKLRSRDAQGMIRVREYLDWDQELEAVGLCLDQQVILPAVIHKEFHAEHDSTLTQIGVAEPVDCIGEAREQIIRLLQSLHYTGMFCIQLKLVEGKVYFHSMQFHGGQNSYALFKSGANLYGALADALCGNAPVLALDQMTYGEHFLHEQTAWQDYTQGYTMKEDLEDALAFADVYLLQDASDPEPGKRFMAQMQKAAFKGELRRAKRRFLKTMKRIFGPGLRKLKHNLLQLPQTKKENHRNRYADKPRIVVAGRNYCSNLCLARAFGTAGYEVEVLRLFQVRPKLHDLMKILKPDAYSQYVKAYHVCVTRRKSAPVIDKLTAIADPKRKMLLIPADDLCANIVDENYSKLSKHYLIPNVGRKAGEINRLMSKEAQKTLAKEAGLPVINSCVIKTQKGQFEIPETVTYPCFMKPNISKNGLKSRMRRCDSEEELRAYLTEFSARSDIEMLVEDFVEIGREYSILGVSTPGCAIGPGFFGAEEGGHDGRRGVALIGEVVPTARRQQLIDDIVRFIGTLNFEGLFDVDLIETESGEMYFVELNMRFGGSGYAITKSGVNLPGMFADYMIQGKPLDTAARIENPGKRFVSEKIMIEEYMTGYLSTSRVRQLMKEVDIHFIQDDVDKTPYRHFRKFYLIANLMRIYYRLKAARAPKDD